MNLSLFPEPSKSGATFSPCGRYRYRLWRRWAPKGKACLFIMLNPSTADEHTNDPTVERCERRARLWGFEALEVVNLFALRSTDPEELYAQEEPVGPTNDGHILEAVLAAGEVICAWGSHGRLRSRAETVKAALQSSGRACYHLGLTIGGEPRHPLYLPYSIEPQPFLNTRNPWPRGSRI